MKKNMGNSDRLIRLVAALVLAIVCFERMIVGTAATFALILAGILLLTSVLGNCPLYSLLGIRTRKSA